MHKTVRPTCANLTSVSHSPINTNMLPKNDHDCFIHFSISKKLKQKLKTLQNLFLKVTIKRIHAFMSFLYLIN